MAGHNLKMTHLFIHGSLLRAKCFSGRQGQSLVCKRPGVNLICFNSVVSKLFLKVLFSY